MANNRLYIRCRQCGETILIGKHFLGALHTSTLSLDKLNEFYEKHNYCGYQHYSLELCEEFPCEMTDNLVDDTGNVCWIKEN